MGRPLSENPSAATLRKRRQMARRRKEGRSVLLLTPPEDTKERLVELARLTGGTVKSEAEMIVRRGVKSALSEAREMAARIGPVYRAAKAYQPYARFLDKPEAEIRVRDRVLRAADWRPLAEALGAFCADRKRSGWSDARTKRFLERAANSAADGEGVGRRREAGERREVGDVTAPHVASG